MTAHERIVVTGATGLIGSALLPLLEPHYEVLTLGRRAPAATVTWLEADLSQPIDLALFPEAAGAVIYLAQSEHFRAFPEHATETFEVNVGNVARLLEWARKAGARRFILASSGGVYGTGARSFHESDPLPSSESLGYYLAGKRCAELLAQAYAPWMDVIVLRFFFVYGAGQRSDMLIPRLVQSIRDGRPVQLQGEQGLRINPTHVSDAARAVRAALGLSGSHVINVAGPEALFLQAIAEEIGVAVGRAPVFERADAQPGHIVADIAEMSRLLGAPQVRFAQGIGALVAGPERG